MPGEKMPRSAMKRSIIVSVIIGLIVAGILHALQAYGILFRAEFVITDLIMRHSNITMPIANHWQYFFITILAFGVAWVTVEGAPRGWAWWLVPVLLLELVCITLIWALYHVFFQPLPSILAIAGSFLLASAYYLVDAWKPRARRRSHVFGACLAAPARKGYRRGFSLSNHARRVMKRQSVVCDIANKYELAEESTAGEFAQHDRGFYSPRHRSVSRARRLYSGGRRRRRGCDFWFSGR